MHDIYRKESGLSRSIEETEERLANAAQEIRERSRQKLEKVQELLRQADQKLRANPWPVIGGVAAACLLLGYYFSSRPRRLTRDYETDD